MLFAVTRAGNGKARTPQDPPDVRSKGIIVAHNEDGFHHGAWTRSGPALLLVFPRS
jgi:hypothetical protein